MTVDRRTLTTAILTTMCALSMSASAKAAAPPDHRGAVMADAPLAHSLAGSVALGAAPPL